MVRRQKKVVREKKLFVSNKRRGVVTLDELYIQNSLFDEISSFKLKKNKFLKFT